ncbi:MAG TPA: circularly permuted type 2 ATP-grasp protein [Actinomycetales bacterium]|nr:circularly permuted type 2 ATP-grasp protein [Actinomycetales bacterium]
MTTAPRHLDAPGGGRAPSALGSRRAWDEMYAAPGLPRAPYEGVHRLLSRMDADDLRARVDAVARTFLDAGVTFDFAGEERPFPLDVVPRILPAAEWDQVEAGVVQRVRALEALLDDVYGEQRAVDDGVLPRHLITSSSHFHRAVAGLEPPTGVRVHVSGTDLVRDEHGRFCVLEDNVRVPSGVSYLLKNRQAVSQILPEAFAAQRVRPVHDYPRRLLAALRATAPEGRDDPEVVVLTPGVYNSAYFEHALLARTMGVQLVEGSDLVCRGGRLWVRTTRGERQVDVVYRRVDDEFLDPVHFRADSVLGCPGLVSVARAGNVTLANAIGNGVADDKLIYTYLPDLVRYYLAEEPVLPNVPTWRLEEPLALAEVLDRLDELVVKPVDGSGGKGLVMGPQASRAELDALRVRLRADPRGWIAQPVLALSTVPTVVDGTLRPRHVDLRPFAINDGSDIWVLPGGLTRVALPEGQLVVNSSQGGGSKDTWVLGDGPAPTPPVRRRAAAPPMAGPDRGPDDGRAQQDQQQQQQQGQQPQRQGQPAPRQGQQQGNQQQGNQQQGKQQQQQQQSLERGSGGC